MRAKARGASATLHEHLPGLDGIRGVAVLGVITTHTLGVIPGGFLGVDIFFALSGYLITSLLVSEWWEDATIALGRFWSRRARRLLPALFLMLTAVGAGAALWPQVFDSQALRGDTLATVLQGANWHLISTHTNYFGHSGPQSPLLHTWSLAIEEQFYLVWPIVVFVVLTVRRRHRTGAATMSALFADPDPQPAVGADAFTAAPDALDTVRPDSASSVSDWSVSDWSASERAVDGAHARARLRRLRTLFWIATVGAGASAVWMAVLTGSGADTTRAYYGSDTRAQAILVGAALALGLRLWGPVRSVRGQSALRAATILGVAGIAALWVFASDDSVLTFHGGFLIAALCTAAVIASVAHHQRTAVGRALEWGPLRYIGRISYGMYLWYWPFVVVLSPSRAHASGVLLLAERLACIVAVATASAYLVELPIRRGHLPGWWAPLAMPSAAVLAVLTTFLATVEVAPTAAAARTPEKALSGPVTATADTKPIKVLIVGDSVAGTLGVGLGQVMTQYGVLAVNEGSPGCSVSMDQLVQVLWFTDPPGTPCQEGNPDALLAQWRTWVDEFNPDVVIYMARSEVLNQEVDGQWAHLGETGFDNWVTGRFHQAIGVLGSRGAHVVLLTTPVYDTGLQPSGGPWPEDDPGRILVDNEIIESMAGLSPAAASASGAAGATSSTSSSTSSTSSSTSSTSSSTSSTSASKKSGRTSKARPRATNHSLIGNNGVTVIDAGAWLSPGGKFTSTVDGITTRCGDGVHLTPAGGQWLAKRILPVVTLLGRSHQEKSPSGSWSGDLALTPPAWYSKLPCGTS